MRNVHVVILLGILMFLSQMLTPGVTNAKTKEIKAISFLQSSSSEAKCFDEYIKRVNQKSQGDFKIKLLGGPEVIPANEQVQAIRNSVVDLAIAPVAYLSRTVPESMAWALSLDTPWEERTNGFLDFMSGFFEKANLHLLGVTGRGSKMYFFLNKEVASLQDLKGLKIRTTSNVSTLLKKLDCRGVTVPRGDIYVAMERKVIDGFLSPSPLVLEYGQQEVCKAWIDHGFLVSVISWIVNQKTWNELTPDVQKMLTSTMAELEKDFYPLWFQGDEKSKAILTEKGIKRIQFAPEDAKVFMNTVFQSYSEDLEKATPQNAEKLRGLMHKRIGH